MTKKETIEQLEKIKDISILHNEEKEAVRKAIEILEMQILNYID